MGAIADFFNTPKNTYAVREELEKVKEETYYLVKFEYHDYDGFALLTEKDKEAFDNYSREDFHLVDSVYKCDQIEFLDYDAWKSCYTWEPISEEERCIINVLIGSRCGYFSYFEVEEDK